MLSRLGTVVVLLALVLTVTFGSTRFTSAQERAGESKPDGAGLATSISTAYDTNATNLATALVGSGVTLVSATYTGAATAAGGFSETGGAIGIDSGIILSSGDIANVVGPNVSDGITANHGLPGDPDLDVLVGGGTLDAAVLELSFTADAQTVSFNYVFSSDEYNEFVNSSFNDVFAFFVNGVNCAEAGGGPVSINNVNGGNPFTGFGPNSGLYRNNDTSDGGGSIDTEMDGLTVVLTCTATVNAEPAVNTLKLAIADRGDRILDSNVFIQGESLTTNVPPVALDDSADADCETATTIDVLANDSDPDSGPAALSIASVVSPTANGGTVTTDGSTVTYTGAAGFSGTDSFSYTITDGQSSSTATVTVTVALCNQPPVALDDFASTFKNTAVVIAVLANDFDPDGDPLTISAFDAVGTPLGGTVVDNLDGTLTYTAPNLSGIDSFTYTITDGVETATATVTVEIINQPPDCSAAAPSIGTIWPPKHQFVAVDALGITDPDGDPLTITVVSIFQDEPTDTFGDGQFVPDGQGVGGSTAEVRAERSGTPKVPGNGRVYHITYVADDGDGGSCTVTLTVGVPHDQGKQAVPVDDGPLYDSTV